MKKENLIYLGFILLFVYILKIFSKRNEKFGGNYFNELDSDGMPLPDQQADEHYTDTPDTVDERMPSKIGDCRNPQFNNTLDISGRMCAGSLINENKVLKLGDQGCEVLLLQQRLNSLQTEINILKPTGNFCCKTRAKLVKLMGVDRYALNQFNQDEQIGFDELQGGRIITPYSYMDVNTYKR